MACTFWKMVGPGKKWGFDGKIKEKSRIELWISYLISFLFILLNWELKTIHSFVENDLRRESTK